MKHDLISRIEKAMPELSKSQRAIGNYIIANYDKSAYLTASKLGAAVGVSESTVVRFAIELGYDGYPALQHALRELIRTRLTSVQRMEITNKRIGENSVLSTVLRSDMDKIKETLETVDPAAFEGAVDTLLGARTIYVMGVRMTGSLASFLTFGLSMIFPNVKQIQTSSGGEIFEQLLRVGEGDVIIPITFPRYSKRIVRGVEYARSYGAKVIAHRQRCLAGRGVRRLSADSPFGYGFVYRLARCAAQHYQCPYRCAVACKTGRAYRYVCAS